MENTTYSIIQNGCNIKISAQIDGKQIGFGEISAVLDVADVIDIGVDSAYRRQGIGREICNRLIAFSAETGVKTLTLEVRKSNSAALALYESLGFCAISERAKYYDDNEDAVIMQLYLPEWA